MGALTTNLDGAGTAADFAAQRAAMVETQLRRRGIRSSRVLAAMQAVPREEFVPADARAKAYADSALVIGLGQTISQPYIVAAVAEGLELSGDECVLEVGAGSAYQAAVLSLLAREVVAIEWDESLAAEACDRLARLGYNNVLVIGDDGALGYPRRAPFDGIAVSAAAPTPPPPLLAQLGEGGRMVIPLGKPDNQELLQVRRRGNEYSRRMICRCRFVPLRGHYGYQPATER
jgi:protein-L-isoaspartate(D-aspartate) O-methyltransferase